MKDNILKSLKECGVIAILRTETPENLVSVSRALKQVVDGARSGGGQ